MSETSTSASIRIESPGYLSFSRNAILRIVAVAASGGLGALLATTLYTNGVRRIMLAYLIALAFVLSLSLGSLFFVLIQHLTRAGWAVMIRRPAEVFALNVFTVAILAIPILLSATAGQYSIYPWARENAPAASLGPMYVHQTFDELTASKTAWLNPAFFVVRILGYFAIWSLIARFYFIHSRHQDEKGGTQDTLQMERWSAPAMFAFAITLTFAAFDLLMSLDPHWYSTIFGVYYFAGCAVGGFSANLLSWLLLTRFGLVPARLSNAHFRDLGRLLFAFVFFWGYIAFSQYMLLWYANIPETTRWWVVRGASMADGYQNSWGFVLVFLLIGHFIIPFLGIMSRHVKGNRQAMIYWTLWLLVMHYVDLYWLVMPEFRSSVAFGLPEISTLAFVGSLYLMGASFIATRIALLPIGDPRSKASIAISDAY